jgi:hypothetical protein
MIAASLMQTFILVKLDSGQYLSNHMGGRTVAVAKMGANWLLALSSFVVYC